MLPLEQWCIEREINTNIPVMRVHVDEDYFYFHRFDLSFGASSSTDRLSRDLSTFDMNWSAPLSDPTVEDPVAVTFDTVQKRTVLITDLYGGGYNPSRIRTSPAGGGPTAVSVTMTDVSRASLLFTEICAAPDESAVYVVGSYTRDDPGYGLHTFFVFRKIPSPYNTQGAVVWDSWDHRADLIGGERSAPLMLPLAVAPGGILYGFLLVGAVQNIYRLDTSTGVLEYKPVTRPDAHVYNRIRVSDDGRIVFWYQAGTGGV